MCTLEEIQLELKYGVANYAIKSELGIEYVRNFKYIYKLFLCVHSTKMFQGNEEAI